jgi:hypothetical protein
MSILRESATRPCWLGDSYGLCHTNAVTPTTQRDAADRLGVALFGPDLITG